MTTWDQFLKDNMQKIFSEKSQVLDIGGGLRISEEKSNRFNPEHRKWIESYLDSTKYVVLDPVPDYNPDVVGDIHDMPFADNSQEAICCMAVLEHVKDPVRACEEMYRVLKPGGYCLVYVPFLYSYHAQEGYYKDYWRFSQDALEYTFRDFSEVELRSVRGAFETWINLSPLSSIPLMPQLSRFLDKILNKTKSNQVSGYYLFAEK